MDESGPPFKVGQLAESRSFVSGYRGAWFRSKIKKIGMRRWETMHALEFYDFPDEKVRWTKLYQLPASRIGHSISKGKKRHIMVRPSFPPIYCESQMPDVNNITDVVVIVRDEWKVWDLVDWWTDNCYWSARITEILGNGKALVELPPPPIGEGFSYEVFCKELRPTLEWSPDDGWTVPISEERESSYCCARLIKPANPVNQEDSQNLVCPIEEVRKNAQLVDCNASFSSHMSTSTLPPVGKLEAHAKRPFILTDQKETNMCSDAVDAGIGKSSYSDSVSSSHIRDTTAEMPGSDAQTKDYETSETLKKMRNDGSIPLNSSCSDTIEAAILDLEELVNQVKWIKGVLRLGTVPSNAKLPLWKFLEHRSSPFPK